MSMKIMLVGFAWPRDMQHHPSRNTKPKHGHPISQPATCIRRRAPQMSPKLIWWCGHMIVTSTHNVHIH